MKRYLKTLGLLLVAAVISLFMLSMKVKKMADDVWQQLGISQSDADLNIRSSFLNGAFYYYGAKNAAKIAAGDRISIIRDLAAHAKKYTQSNEFKKAYADYRARKKPADPYIIKYSVDSMREAERLQIQNAIKATEANVNHPNPKVRNGVPYALENLRKQLAAIDDPNNRVIKSKMDYAQRQNDAATKQYQERMKKYEAECPENPQVLIKARLQEMINILSDVDYNAGLTEKGKFKVFADPLYEKKPKEWKLAYRTGKPAADALKAIAQKWMDEIKP
jgi:hypothetical protein